MAKKSTLPGVAHEARISSLCIFSRPLGIFSDDATSKMLSSLKIPDVVCWGLHIKNWKGRLEIPDTASPFRKETQAHIWGDCPSLEQGPSGGLGLPSDPEEEAFAHWRTLNSKLKKMTNWPESVIYLMYKVWCRSFWPMSTSPSCLSGSLLEDFMFSLDLNLFLN